MNKQPYTIPPRWWEPKLSPSVVRWSRRYRRWKLRSQQRIGSIHVSGEEHLRASLEAGHGLLVAPNHAAHFDSAALYVAADQLHTPLYFMTAWQVFGMASRWDQFLMQRLGCFSIDRESKDRRAYKQAVAILQNQRCPLVIFPEGDIYHVTDRVTPFRDGASAIALSAARRGPRTIVIVPCGIKFRYVDDPLPELHRLMTQLDERLFLRPEPHRALVERIYRFAEAMLALKEIEYLAGCQSGSLVNRISNLAQSILQELESQYQISAAEAAVPDRVKALRQAIIPRLDRIKEQHPSEPTREFVALSRDMDSLFLVMQLYSYPGDYLTDNPTVERLAETLDKFEEDVFDRAVPSVRGRRHVDIRFGPPIAVADYSPARSGTSELTARMRTAVQKLIDDLSAVPERYQHRAPLTVSH